MNVFFIEYTYNGIEKNKVIQGIFSILNNDISKLYWHYGPGYTDLETLKNAKILKSFTSIDQDDYDTLDAIDDEFDITYPIQPSSIHNLKVNDIDAWISPAGHVYISSWQAHIHTAAHIARCLYMNEKDDPNYERHPDIFLTKKGWMSLSHSYVSWDYSKAFTEKQREILLQIKLMNEGFILYQDNIERALSYYG